MFFSGFAITINVSPKKRVTNNRRPFGELSDEIQRNLIEMILNTQVDKYESLQIVYRVFEYTNNNLPHLHAYIIDKEPLSMKLKMEKIQIAIHKQLGFPRLQPKICCFVEETIVNQCFWDIYTKKDIDEWYLTLDRELSEDEEPIHVPKKNLFSNRCP